MDDDLSEARPQADDVRRPPPEGVSNLGSGPAFAQERRAGPFGHSAGLEAPRQRVERFVDEECIPREDACLAHDVDRLDDAAHQLRVLARRAGVYAPQLLLAWGGLELSWRDRGVVR